MVNTAWTPSPADYLQALEDQNAWHSTGTVPSHLFKPTRRYLADELWKSVKDSGKRFQLILGPRRVGKSITLGQTAQSLIDWGISPKQIWHMRMDHPLLMHFDLGGWVRSVLNAFQSPHQEIFYFLIDEINYSPGWDKWLKTFYDDAWPVRIVATSSSIAALRSRTIESGIGRWTEQYLTPYSFSEYLSLKRGYECALGAEMSLHATIRKFTESSNTLSNLSNDRERFLLVGGFPELLLEGDASNEDVQSALLRSQFTLRNEAVQRVTGMDLPQVFDIRHPMILERLLYLLGQHMTGLVNVTKLADSVELTRSTINQYIAYLEKAFLIFMLPNYSPKEDASQRKAKKVFFVDGAVRNAALQRGLAPLSDAHERSMLVENAAAAHLYCMSLQEGYRTFHWRHGRYEVDLVYGHPTDPVAFEITTGASHHLKGLAELQERYPRFRKRCYLVSARSNASIHPEDSNDGVGRIPFDTFLLAVSAQTQLALRNQLQTHS